ncbi:MAG TPA: choice-of-anchor Q domain-containing protein, partial [Sedimentisphaerales bacterium]|nr:choice-of-anchor Q domain-containing protein [Sedimentisphaerales bacterium]
ATGANYGSSWEDAFNYLQSALSVARNGDEIRVADGIYKPDEDADNPTGTGDREATFQLKKGVTIKGGYAGTGAPDPNIRDIETYETILSGDLAGNDVDVNDPCDLLTEPTRLENSYHVVTNSNIDETAVLDGFTITAGNANGSPDYERDRGGGMFNNGHDNPCNPTVAGCTFFGNSGVEFGGGMFNYGHGDGECNPIITDCTFLRNASGSEGGGMSSWGGHSVVTNCTFGGNYSRYCGGGMSNTGSNPTVSNCTFSYNSTNGRGGGMWNYEFSSPTLTNCLFSGNSVANEGGGMCNEFFSAPTVTNSILWDNTDAGGADESAQIHNYESTPVINHTCIEGWTGALGGIGNIGDDPMFRDADGPDNIAGTVDDNLRLMEGSPCIDNGNNAAIPVEVDTDLDGHPRIIDGDCNDTDTVDMGAYEFNYAYMGDFDYNCEVDFGDFAILALAWLTEPKDAQWNPTCDINIHNDSSINMLDLHVFVENWLAGIE